MQDTKPKFRRESPELRREQLVEATLRVIAQKGLAAATVREISSEAGVAFSLIRHHFESKEELMYAAYAHHMQKMSKISLNAAQDATLTVEEKLRHCITDSLSPPITDADALRVWAGFIQMVPRDPRMRQIHMDNYLAFRHSLEPLIVEASVVLGQVLTPQEIEHRTIACNAVLDGLWLEGSMLPDMLPPAHMIAVAETTIFAILGLALPTSAEGQR